MRLERLQAETLPAPGRSVAGLFAWGALGLLLLGSRPALAGDEGDPSRDGDAKDDTVEPAFSGSFTARALVAGGRGNDTGSARLALEWNVRNWTGGFSLEASSESLDDFVLSSDDVGSVALTERWIAWGRETRAGETSLRLGTAYGVRFGEGLVLGAAAFDGLMIHADASKRVRIIALAGRTDIVDPEDFWDEPWGLFPPDDMELGSRGNLIGLRTEVLASETTTCGFNLLAARGDGTPTAGLASADVRVSTKLAEVSAEIAGRRGGGSALYVRSTFSPHDTLRLHVEHRHLDELDSPLGDPPRYSGLSSSGDVKEQGWFLGMDWSPTRRFTGSWSYDWSDSVDSSAKRSLLQDARMALQFVLTERDALSYGIEHEFTGDEYDGTLQSLLYTHSFDKGARLSARLAHDQATKDVRDTLRLGYRVPLRQRKVTLLFDDTLRSEKGEVKNACSAGASIRLGKSSFVTIRGSLAEDEDDSVDITWYRRF